MDSIGLNRWMKRLNRFEKHPAEILGFAELFVSSQGGGVFYSSRGVKRPCVGKRLHFHTPSKVADTLLKCGWRVGTYAADNCVHLVKGAAEIYVWSE